MFFGFWPGVLFDVFGICFGFVQFRFGLGIVELGFEVCFLWAWVWGLLSFGNELGVLLDLVLGFRFCLILVWCLFSVVRAGGLVSFGVWGVCSLSLGFVFFGLGLRVSFGFFLGFCVCFVLGLGLGFCLIWV